MRLVPGFAIAALAASLAMSAQAQEAKIDPMLAKQCSVWASYMSSNVDDENAQQALLFATNYFTGYYEGATGRAIGDTTDRDALLEVANDINGFTQRRAEEMQAFGTRMGEWGRIVSALGEEEPAE